MYHYNLRWCWQLTSNGFRLKYVEPGRFSLSICCCEVKTESCFSMAFTWKKIITNHSLTALDRKNVQKQQQNESLQKNISYFLVQKSGSEINIKLHLFLNCWSVLQPPKKTVVVISLRLSNSVKCINLFEWLFTQVFVLFFFPEKKRYQSVKKLTEIGYVNIRLYTMFFKSYTGFMGKL